MKLFKIADRDDYLRDLGASEEIISYIMSLDENQSQYQTNEFRKNPSITLQELQGVQVPDKPVPVLSWERDIVKQHSYAHLDEKSITWLIYQARKKIRNEYGEYPIAPNPNATDNEVAMYVKENGSYMVSFESEFQGLRSEGVWDWYRAVLPDIVGMSLDDIYRANTEWHQVVSEGGAGQVYMERTILYGPTWTDKEGNTKEEYSGWTVQEVTTQNDLEVEGNLMGHCVGSYWNDYNDTIVGTHGQIARIFSLRDPSNQPHVTIESDESGINADQIQGHSNSVPKKEYKEMIKFWVTQGGSTLETSDDDENDFYHAVQSHKGIRIDKYVDELSRTLLGDADEYGLTSDEQGIFENRIDDVLENGRNMVQNYNERGYGYHGDGGIGDLLAKYSIKEGDEAIDYLIKKFETYQEEADEWYTDSYWDGPSFPEEEDFKDTDAYNEAVKEYDTLEDERRKEYWPTAWVSGLYEDLMKEFARVRGEKLWDWYQKYMVEQKDPVAASSKWYKGYRLRK